MKMLKWFYASIEMFEPIFFTKKIVHQTDL
jgi:hypothetical protein